MSNGKSRSLIPPGLSYLADNVLSKQNILGDAKSSRAKWAKGLKFSKNESVVFFAGCGYQYSDDLASLMGLIRSMDKSRIGSDLPMGIASLQKKIGIDIGGVYRKVAARGDAGSKPLRDAVKVLQGLGIDFGYLGENEPCCGGILHYIGLQEDFKKNADDVRKAFASRGVKQVIGIVPSCTYTLKNLVYNNHSEGFEVKHFIEIVAERIGSLNLHYPKQIKAVYHDPCQLGRYLGLVEEPRTILKAISGIELVETEWTQREWSTCCGGGGGFEAVFPELSHILAVNRTKELLDTGAEVIVTHCPGCILQLKSGLKELKQENVEVLDLAEILAESM